jgi:hypothetical protein
MRMTTRAAMIAVAAMLCLRPSVAQAQTEPQPRQIVRQAPDLDAMKAKLADIEKQLADVRKAQEELKNAQCANAPTVTNATKGAKMKIDGRIFLGLFNSGKQGSYPNWSTDIPDAKLRFTFCPAQNITVVNRLSFKPVKSGSTTSPVDLDYFYADFAHTLGATNALRLGQRKIDVGQETWVDNPIENMLINNSVSHVSGYGIGLAGVGKFSGGVYELGFVNGPKGVTSRPSTGLPVNAKIGGWLLGNVFGSASFFSTGRLGAADNSAISVAEISSAPTGATAWKRNLCELDLRYNYGPTGIRNLIPTGKLPPVMLGATWGKFNDSAEGAPGRDGAYWFVEGLVRMSAKLYAAARYSVTDLSGSAVASLAKSPVPVNSYRRTSVGLGYAITDLAQWKMEYSINDTTGGASEPSLNQWATGIAAKF